MIDRATLAIILIKFFGLELIFAGIVLMCIKQLNVYFILITVGSLVFAVGSNILLVYTIRQSKKQRKE